MKKKIIIIFILIFTIVGIVYAATGYRVNNGTIVTVDEHSTCQKVTNSSGVDYFVPTKTSGEWSAFRGNLPGGVSLGGCVVEQTTGMVCLPLSTSEFNNACSSSFGVGWIFNRYGTVIHIGDFTTGGCMPQYGGVTYNGTLVCSK